MACAKGLADVDEMEVTLLDKTGHHQFQPLLYQVATAELPPSDVRFDLAHMFRDDDSVEVRTDEVVSCDPQEHSVTLGSGKIIEGDVLVLAAGTQPNFFRTPGAEEFAFPLYSVEHAQRIRDQLLQLFHDAAAKPELIEDGALTFVIVGGGPTGVETAGALSDLVNDVMPHQYSHAAAGAAKVILVDIGHTILNGFSDDAHAYAAQQFDGRGVELRLGMSAKEVTAHNIVLSDGTTIPSHLVVWAGGETASPLAPTLPESPRAAVVASTSDPTSPSEVSPGCTHWETSRTSPTATSRPYRSWPAWLSSPAPGRPGTSWPISFTAAARHSTITIRESWP